MESYGKIAVYKLLYVSKQAQNKIQTSYGRKYLKTRLILTIFESGSQTLGHGKLAKVMEFEKR